MTTPTAGIRVVVLASGTGTLADSILRAAGEHYSVVGLVSDKQCPAVDKARAAGVATTVVTLDKGLDRDVWDERLRDAVSQLSPDVVVSAGFMRILGPAFLGEFSPRIINTHPALLPAFPGAHAVRDALAYGVKVTGTTVHVVDAGVDTGPIIAQRAVSVRDGEGEADLHERIKQQERALIVEVLTGGVVDLIDQAVARREAHRQ